MKNSIIIVFLLVAISLTAQKVTIGNSSIRRVLSFDGTVWRTVQFSGAGNKTIAVSKSEEFNILPFNSNRSFSISDFMAAKKPFSYVHGDTSFLEVQYKPKPAIANLEAVPRSLTVQYFVIKDQKVIRKKIILDYDKPSVVDRLEVERFVVEEKAAGGGRGEPVFVNDTWFLGLEYPAGYSRHTDGNTPASYSRYYDKVGNYSFISLDGRDIEPNAAKGMIRLMHFPGYTKMENNGINKIYSKTAVIGVAQQGYDAEYAFMQYLSTIWKSPRSFLHYNNWFEPKAKDLSGDGLIDIWKEFRNAITPYGVRMDAMVVDDGWQNRQSVWDPLPKFFPNGFDDVRKLSDKLHAEGTGFGLWLSINGYVNDIDWGKAQGYKEAERNSYFKHYGRYYSLSDTAYKNEVVKKIPAIIAKSNAVYYKHDFNQLCDLSDSTGHPPTDRHGHEANLDAAIDVLLATKMQNPKIYQNLTNWIWFSPWWLMYADYLWMLAGDDGTNGNWPEISTRAMATTDRDTYIWRMFGNKADHPLVPISRLMTHGIVKTSNGRMESKEDNLQDWTDYVLMHYGRGTLLKEWYISPQVMSADQWKALCIVHNWAGKHQAELINTVFVGDRPDEGHAYGYIGWAKEKAVLVARNTNAATQKLIIPFNKQMQFYASKGQQYKATVVYPYRSAYPGLFISGKDIVIEMPGYSTMAFEFEKGKAVAVPNSQENIKFTTAKNSATTIKTVITIPADVEGQCDLLLIGFPDLPVVTINGDSVKPKRTSKAKLNNFSNYAKEGMKSEKAKDWKMIAVDLLPYAGKKIEIEYNRTEGFESHILAEQKINNQTKQTAGQDLWFIGNGRRRNTIQLF